MKKFLFYMGHPAHYHNFKHSIRLLLAEGHSVKVVARGKDVLFDLLSTENWDLVRLPARSGSGKAGMVLGIIKRELTLYRIARRYCPGLMIGTDLVITHVGRLLKIPTIVVNEDDSHAVPLMARYAFPYATAVLAPFCCDQKPANHKKIGYAGYHELAYLHPDFFKPDRGELPSEFRENKVYFILRFASLHAHHDEGRRGITDELAMKLIELLEPHGQVYITSERPFAERLEKYRLPVAPDKMHQVMAHASMYIGDSQTMAAEAAVLGIPSIRFNDFVGELSYLEELEHTYQLTRGIRTSQPSRLIQTVSDWLSDNSIDIKWRKRKEEMLNKTISVTPFWVETFKKFNT